MTALSLTAQRLHPVERGKYVAWAATPDLDQVEKLGALDDDLRLTGQVTFNKFMVFITLETSSEGETWTGPIVLRGVSRSSLMASWNEHEIFEFLC